MMISSLLTLLMILFAGPAFAQNFAVPPLTGPVVDAANILSPQAHTQLSSLLQQLHSQGGTQIQIVTLPTLGDLPIEDASIKIVDTYKLGREGKDDGILFLVAPNDRKMRIEVGRGKEGDLTDVQSKRIIRDVVTPHFRAGKFSDGIVDGTISIISLTDPEFKLDSVQNAPRRQQRPGAFKLTGLIIFIIAIVLISRFLDMFGGGGPRGMSGGRRMSGWGGGGFGGSGGGFGGGWSGGGGGFSGGGSSGSW
jgi:uncharacterized protein